MTHVLVVFLVYKNVCTPVIGKELRCQREEGNPRDPYAVVSYDYIMYWGCKGGDCRAHSALFINTLFIVYKAKWCIALYSH